MEEKRPEPTENAPQAPGRDPVQEALQYHIVKFWAKKNQLLNMIPTENNARNFVKRVIDGRVLEKVSAVVPARQRLLAQLPERFSTLAETLKVFNLVYSYDEDWTVKFLEQSIALVSLPVHAIIDTPQLKALLEDWHAKDSIMATVVVAAAPWLALQGLTLIGFASGGIVAGSIAAAWQSAIGSVAAGSLFSSFQSMAALGALTAPWAIGVAVVGGGAYGIYKLATKPSSTEKLARLMGDLLRKKDKRDEFWGKIGV